MTLVKLINEPLIGSQNRLHIQLNQVNQIEWRVLRTIRATTVDGECCEGKKARKMTRLNDDSEFGPSRSESIRVDYGLDWKWQAEEWRKNDERGEVKANERFTDETCTTVDLVLCRCRTKCRRLHSAMDGNWILPWFSRHWSDTICRCDNCRQCSGPIDSNCRDDRPCCTIEICDRRSSIVRSAWFEEMRACNLRSKIALDLSSAKKEVTIKSIKQNKKESKLNVRLAYEESERWAFWRCWVLWWIDVGGCNVRKSVREAQKKRKEKSRLWHFQPPKMGKTLQNRANQKRLTTSSPASMCSKAVNSSRQRKTSHSRLRVSRRQMIRKKFDKQDSKMKSVGLTDWLATVRTDPKMDRNKWTSDCTSSIEWWIQVGRPPNRSAASRQCTCTAPTLRTSYALFDRQKRISTIKTIEI